MRRLPAAGRLPERQASQGYHPPIAGWWERVRQSCTGDGGMSSGSATEAVRHEALGSRSLPGRWAAAGGAGLGPAAPPARLRGARGAQQARPRAPGKRAAAPARPCPARGARTAVGIAPPCASRSARGWVGGRRGSNPLCLSDSSSHQGSRGRVSEIPPCKRFARPTSRHPPYPEQPGPQAPPTPGTARARPDGDQRRSAGRSWHPAAARPWVLQPAGPMPPRPLKAGRGQGVGGQSLGAAPA